MRIFFFSDKWVIILCFVFWLFFEVLAGAIAKAIPNSYYSKDSFLFRERKWEKGGKFYLNIFKIRKWKKFLPDGAAFQKDGFRKKTLTNYSKENLELFILESRRAELIHFLSILPFWTFGFFAPTRIVVYMLIYALLFNLPCVVTQRYNRPRVIRLLNSNSTHFQN